MSSSTLPTLAELHAAQRLVQAAMPPSPQYVWPQIAAPFGAEVWMKHENHGPVGAFKLRGGLVYVDALRRRDPSCTELVSATRGNHGQSIGFAVRRAGLKATIYVPIGNSTEKNSAMRSLGVQLIEHGEDFQAASDQARLAAAERGAHFVESFDPVLISGVASYWLEFFAAQPALDVVYVPIGMGSGICACIAARAALNLRTRIVGVVSAHAPACALSLARGELIEAPATTRLADGLACRRPNADALALIRAQVEEVLMVSDAEVAAAMRWIFRATHNVVEGAGAASLAGAWQQRARLAGLKVGVVATGGNVDSSLFALVLREEGLT
ncbi:MAG: threonine dehydratase [Steroidobacteraceae bacterium]